MKQYIVEIEVIFEQSRRLDKEVKAEKGPSLGPLVKGYYRNFGLNAISSDDAVELVTRDVTDGTISLPVQAVREVNIKNLDKVITRGFMAANVAEIWYRSGRVYYQE